MKLLLVAFLAAVGRTSAASADKGPVPTRVIPNRIVGGILATDGEFPSYAIPGYGGDSCGGVLIHPDMILSAAHCQGVWEDAPAGGRVYIGMNNVDGSDATETLYAESEHNHPMYNGDTFENDISLVKLRNAASVEPANWNSNPNLPADNDAVTVCGFGTTSSGGSDSEELLKVTVSAINPDTCVSQYGGSVFPDQMLCAAGPLKDSCQGDSGGPLFQADGSVVGIVSWGYGCADPRYPGVYARVSNYDAFIQRVICDESDFEPTGFDCPDAPVCGDGFCDGAESCSTCAIDCGLCPISCSEGINEASLASSTREQYEVAVPAGAILECATSGGTGDADLYMTFGSSQCKSTSASNNEECRTTVSTEEMVVAVEVVAWSAFTGVQLVCGCSGLDPEDIPGPSTEPTSATSVLPTVAPSLLPTSQPSMRPTVQPSKEPTVEPVIDEADPTPEPSASPTDDGPNEIAGSAMVRLFFQPLNEDLSEAETEAFIAPVGEVICRHLERNLRSYFGTDAISLPTCTYAPAPDSTLTSSPFVILFDFTVRFEDSESRAGAIIQQQEIDDAVAQAFAGSAQDELVDELQTLPDSNPLAESTGVSLAMESPEVDDGCSILPDFLLAIPLLGAILNALLCIIFGGL